MKEKFYYIFILVVYKNYKDLTDFANSLQKVRINSKVVVVDNYSSDEVCAEVKRICNKYNFDYIANTNNGYGGGNNKGISYVLENYTFEYIVVSNPDIELVNIPETLPSSFGNGIVGPRITSASGRNQNPFLISDIPIRDFFVYRGYLKHSALLINIGLFFSRFRKLLFLIFNSKKNDCRLFAIHGSFFFISKYALLKLYPLFDEQFFIFCEEQDLAKRCKKMDIPVIYSDNMEVYHKEDGSMKLVSRNLISDAARDSTIKFYKKWYR